MKRYRCLLLDLDYTVLDFPKTERRAFFEAMQEMHLPASDEDYKRYNAINQALWEALERGEVESERLRTLRFERLLAVRKLPLDYAEVNRRYLNHVATGGYPYDGALSLVRALHTKYRICIVTNGVRWSQHSRVRQAGLEPLTDGMVTSEEAGAPKPQPAVFTLAMKRMEQRAEDCLVIGDSLTADIAGAAAAGIDSLWYAPGDKRAAGPQPTYIAHTYGEIADLLGVSYNQSCGSN